MAAKADLHRFDDLFAEFGRITLRRMFGGEGIYAGDEIIGIVMADRIYFKTDAVTRQAFIQEGCGPFAYAARGETRESHSYYAMPDRLYDDPDELAVWARRAQAVSRAKPKKTTKKKKTKARR